jgi:hypothetical protein
MQGITLQANSNGQTIITIDSANLDPVASPLVEGLLELVRRTDAETAQERVDWRTLAHASLNRVYGADEPGRGTADYSDVPAYQL